MSSFSVSPCLCGSVRGSDRSVTIPLRSVRPLRLPYVVHVLDSQTEALPNATAFFLAFPEPVQEDDGPGKRHESAEHDVVPNHCGSPSPTTIIAAAVMASQAPIPPSPTSRRMRSRIKPGRISGRLPPRWRRRPACRPAATAARVSILASSFERSRWRGGRYA
jgi:hypothetical protein